MLPPRPIALFACGPLMRRLFDAVPEAMRGAHAVGFCRAGADRRAARCAPGDAILVKGSLGSRMKLRGQRARDQRAEAA